ncbi:30S ribosomal protein S1 [Urbifossiella limnaea]|uniref:30S ribosomal protein S1 n=1 Tax=Urbifossiella limnaea TaxID=2528023 RepID=A0A517XVN4_9BACT|nr:S1 RNA-binding domain-containing protein [Urbifossiella limnaea]QDU21573.1 30S ribosomal protein S1 [Urbifossiella limnaea]
MSLPTDPSPAPETPVSPTPAPEAAAAPAPAPAAPPKTFSPPQPGGPRRGGPTRPFIPQGNRPREEGQGPPQGGQQPQQGPGTQGRVQGPNTAGGKPFNPGGKPAQLDKKDFFDSKPNNRELDKLIEDELAQAMAGFDVSATVAQAETQHKPKAPGAPATRKVGVVVGIHGKDVFVEVPGGRSQGVLPIQQFEGRTPVVGESVEFDIERYDAANGLLVLTREGSTQVVTDWSQVSYGMIVEAKVTGTNKNKTGLTVEVNGIKGFLPASQLDLYRVEDITQFENQRIKVMVAEVNPSERNLIVSRRAVMERDRQVKAEQFWATVQVDQTKSGIVRSVKPFGVFVDLGGADGLIPAGELSWQRVETPEGLFKVGDSVEVLITRVNFEERKIGLSLRALTESPWTAFAERVKAGARVTGTVTRTADYGAFVELEPGIEGLIHISELSTQRVRKARDVVQPGQSVEVEVLSVDVPARRIALSLKSIQRAAEDSADAATAEEEEQALREAQFRMANRPLNPNLRGGI